MGSADKNQGGGAVEAGGWGESCYSYCPPTKICVTHKETGKIGSVRETAWRFGPEVLIKTEFVIIYCKKSIDRAF